MASLQELQFALTAADQAGNTEDARALAQAIVKLRNQAPEPSKFDDPGIGKTLLIGAGRTFDRVGKGMQQLYYGATGNDAELKALSERAASDDKAYKPLQEARPWATGIGESLPSMVLPGGGARTLLGQAAAMGLAAGVPGALEYGDAGDRLLKGGVGFAAGAALPVGAAALKTGKSFLEPLYNAGRETIGGRTLNRVAGDDVASVISKLQSGGPLVPGSMPTAGQLAENGGINALERSASASNPQAYAQRAMEQASARLSALRGIAGDDAALAAAKGARDDAAGPLYDQAKAQMMKNTPELNAIIESLPPSVLAKANSLAMLARDPLKSGKDIPAGIEFVGGLSKSVAGPHGHTKTVQLPGLLDEMGNPLTRTTEAQSSQYSGKALHYIKLALDDTLGKTGESALGKVEKRLMTGAKDDFLGLVDNGIPAYGQARKSFAELSRPVNQMQIGQELLNKLQPALNDFGQLGIETKATFANAMRGGDRLAEKATGFKGAKLDSVMSPDQMQILNNIAMDLGRKANAENIGRGVGSDTFQKLAMQNIAEQSGMPRLMSGLLDTPGVSRATKWVYRDTDEKVQKLLADALLNPAKAAELMQAARSGAFDNNPALKRLIEQSVMRGGGLLGSAALAQP